MGSELSSESDEEYTVRGDRRSSRPQPRTCASCGCSSDGSAWGSYGPENDLVPEMHVPIGVHCLECRRAASKGKCGGKGKGKRSKGKGKSSGLSLTADSAWNASHRGYGDFAQMTPFERFLWDSWEALPPGIHDERRWGRAHPGSDPPTPTTSRCATSCGSNATDLADSAVRTFPTPELGARVLEYLRRTDIFP